MKNIFKVLGFIALVAVVGFSFITCGDGGSSDNGFIGSTLIINNAQVYSADFSLESRWYEFNLFNETVTGLNYIFVDSDSPTGESGYFPLDELINGTKTVTLENGKFSINIGTPKPSALIRLSILKMIYPNLTISPNDAKHLAINYFYDSNNIGSRKSIGLGEYLREINYIYVDKNVTVNGTGVDFQGTTHNFSLDLKTGWNSFIVTYNVNYDNSHIDISYRSGTPTADFKWILNYNFSSHPIH
jgi:hypothetical protein